MLTNETTNPNQNKKNEMNILILKSYYEPEIAAGIVLDANTAEDLAKSGHTVHLFTPTPTRGISQEVRDNTSMEEEKIDGRLKIHRYKMMREKHSLIAKTGRYFLCAWKQWRIGCKSRDMDLIFVGTTPPFLGLIAASIKKKKKIPFVYNAQDIFPDSMVTAGITKEGSFLWKIGSKIASSTYKSADKIIVISEEMRDNLLSKGVPASKIEVVYNWVDEEIIHPVKKEDNRLITELNIPQYDFSIVYAGNLGRAQSVETVIEAAELLKDNPQIGFYILGDGANKEAIEASIMEKGLTNVHTYPLQPYERVSEVYSLGDASVVTCKAGTGGNALPSKTWSIMACEKPILVCFDKDTMLERLTKENECGLFATAEDAQALRDNIVALSKDKVRCEHLGQNARDYVEEHLTRNSCTAKIARILEEAKAKFEK